MGRRFGGFVVLAALWVAALIGPAARAAVIHVTTDVTGNIAQIEQNQTVTVNVRALIDGPASANDGIFTFDQDLILANLVNNQPSVLSVESVNRPNVSDNLFTGSNGTATASGLHSIYGGYFPDTLGIGSPTLLFSVVLKGIAIGTDTVTPGPSIDPFGFDFVLYQSSLTNTLVTYDGGVRIAVIASTGGGPGGGGGNPVPLPPALGCGILSAILVCPLARRRLRQHS